MKKLAVLGLLLIANVSPADAAWSSCQCWTRNWTDGLYDWYMTARNDSGISFVIDESQGRGGYIEMYNGCSRELQYRINNGLCK